MSGTLLRDDNFDSTLMYCLSTIHTSVQVTVWCKLSSNWDKKRNGQAKQQQGDLTSNIRLKFGSYS